MLNRFSCVWLSVTQGSNPRLLCLLNWQVGSLPLVLPGKPFDNTFLIKNIQNLINLWLRKVLSSSWSWFSGLRPAECVASSLAMGTCVCLRISTQDTRGWPPTITTHMASPLLAAWCQFLDLPTSLPPFLSLTPPGSGCFEPGDSHTGHLWVYSYSETTPCACKEPEWLTAWHPRTLASCRISRAIVILRGIVAIYFTSLLLQTVSTKGVKSQATLTT